MEEFFPGKGRIRSPVVGGIFYPEDKAGVLSMLSAPLPAGQNAEKNGRATALIAPHGAWEISGSVAKAAFSAAAVTAADRGGAKSPSRIVLMGPIHDLREDGLFLSDSHAFRTPLGDIPVDREISEKLFSCSTLFEINDIPHLREHSLEVLLPFVKYGFPGAKIVPVLMGNPRPALISALARALRVIFEPILDDTLLVISSNLSIDTDETRSLGQAEECIRRLFEKDADALIAGLAEKRFKLCGGGLVASLLKSGLVDSMQARLITRPLLKGQTEDGAVIYFGALSYERVR
ncbi:MAG: AmmeMemoRadiSam system protein B [Treponema sp.]|jgi:AmmeMemoRadiSam system protein B|nr:AmmeMemoRadiSam system protein B [Treponema sp.]